MIYEKPCHIHCQHSCQVSWGFKKFYLLFKYHSRLDFRWLKLTHTDFIQTFLTFQTFYYKIGFWNTYIYLFLYRILVHNRKSYLYSKSCKYNLKTINSLHIFINFTTISINILLKKAVSFEFFLDMYLKFTSNFTWIIFGLLMKYYIIILNNSFKQ